MTLPVGITTCTATIGAGYTFLGEEAVISGTVVADRNVVWAATGAPIFKTESVVTPSSPGGQASFVVPHVDQDGFVDGAGNDITGWYYTFSGRATFEGNRVEAITKRFQVVVGQTTVDLDLVPDGPVIPGVTTPTAAVTSVNGETGAVTVAGGLDDSDIAALVADPDSDTAGALAASIAEAIEDAGGGGFPAATEVTDLDAATTAGPYWFYPNAAAAPVREPEYGGAPTVFTLLVLNSESGGVTQTATYCDDDSGEPLAVPHVYVRTLNYFSSVWTNWVEVTKAGGYEPPEGGIPKADLATVVQASLDKADAAFARPDVTAAFLGQVNGVAVSPAAIPPAWGQELWTLANLAPGISEGQNSTLAPTLVADGTAKNLRTLASIGNLANRDRCFRLSLTVDALPTNGWAALAVVMCNAGGGTVAGTQKQRIFNNAAVNGSDLGIPVIFEFSNVKFDAGTAYLDLQLEVKNNATAGAVTVKDVSLREVARTQRPMKFGRGASIAVPDLYIPLFDPPGNTWRMVRHVFGSDGAMDLALSGVDGFNEDTVFRYDGPDPYFVADTVDIADRAGEDSIQFTAGQVQREMRGNNNDQIMYAQKTDLSYELRGNTHGGETIRSGGANKKLEYDKGDGSWVTWDGTGTYLRNARRFRSTFNTQIQRSDAGSPFAEVDHRCTFYSDGVMRMDRTTRFVATQRLKTQFDWMSSHTGTVPRVGRIGNGLTVQDEVDIFPKVAPPAIPTVTPATTGGVLAAGTYGYTVTALATGGETTPSPVATGTTTGSTGKNTVAWSAVANATGYRIYGRTNGIGVQTLLATVGPAAVSWVDDGSTAGTARPPTVNRARRLEANTVDYDTANSDSASWAVWYDPITNLCMGNIYDRDAILNRAGVASVKVRLEAGAGIIKNYLNVVFTADSTDVFDGENTPSHLFVSGTEWNATHWAFTYVPADPAEYHNEIAARAANLTTLKAIYPAT